MFKTSTPQSALFDIRVVVATVLCLTGASLGLLSWASTPPSDTITVPSTPGVTITNSWSGTIPPLTNQNSDCSAPFAGTPAVDQHVSTVTVPPGVYSNVDAVFTFKINWNPVTGDEIFSDEILTVIGPDGNELNS